MLDVYIILLLTVGNLGLDALHYWPRYHNLAVTIFIIRMLAPSLAVIMLLRWPGSWYRTLSIFFLGPIAGILLLILGIWTMCSEGKIYGPADEMENSCGGYNYNKVILGKQFYTLVCKTDQTGSPLILTKNYFVNDYFMKYVCSVELPTDTSAQFIDDQSGPLQVKLSRIKGDKESFLMNANVDDLLSGKVKLGPEQ